MTARFPDNNGFVLSLFYTQADIPADQAPVSYTHLDVYKRQAGDILSDFEDKADKVAAGALSYEEAQQAIRETLRQQGYRPPA